MLRPSRLWYVMYPDLVVLRHGCKWLGAALCEHLNRQLSLQPPIHQWR